MLKEKMIEISQIHAKYIVEEIFSVPSGFFEFEPELRNLLKNFSEKGNGFKVITYTGKEDKHPSIFYEDEWRKAFKTEIFFTLIREENDKNFELTDYLAFFRMMYLFAYDDISIIKMVCAFDDKYKESYEIIVKSEKISIK